MFTYNFFKGNLNFDKLEVLELIPRTKSYILMDYDSFDNIRYS